MRKKRRRRVKDGEVVNCLCSILPTNAIVFGDMKDPKARSTQIMACRAERKSIHVLEELNVQPNIGYLD